MAAGLRPPRPMSNRLRLGCLLTWWVLVCVCAVALCDSAGAAEPSLPLVCPGVAMPSSAVEPEQPPAPKAHDNGSAYLYAGGNLKNDFSLRADFTLPEVPSNTSLFYTNWLILIPLVKLPQPFVQIEVMRWKRFDYRAEVAITWQLSGGKLIYVDTPTFLGPESTISRLWFTVTTSG